MKAYNIYLLTVASLLLLTTVILVALEQRSVGVYYTLYIIEALVATELFGHFNKKARTGLNLVSVMLFSGFIFIVFLNILDRLR